MQRDLRRWLRRPRDAGLGDGLDPRRLPDNCDNAAGTLSDAAFIIATTPSAGDRVESGFEVKGCSRTFESNVNWRLVARNGTELARGSTQEGGVDGPGPFAFTVAYTADQPQIGHLELFEEEPRTGRVSARADSFTVGSQALSGDKPRLPLQSALAAIF